MLGLAAVNDMDLVMTALTELVPAVRRGQVARGGGRMLRWVEAGHGDPTVVLAVGSPDNALIWAGVLPLLVGQARVIAYDRAGLGPATATGGAATCCWPPRTASCGGCWR
jgi:pimeloyl-ACP methyl ester carboxylesterase